MGEVIFRDLAFILYFPNLGIALLLLCASAHHNLELSLVQRHQAEVKAREETAEAEEDTEEDHAGPGWQQWPPGKYLSNIVITVATFL